MDTQDLDEEEKKRRKAQQVEWRTKKNRSFWFMLGATVFEIVETIIIMLVLFLLVSFIMLRLLNPDNATVQLVYQILLIAVFIGSLVGGFLIYKAIIRWVIEKFNLEDVLMEDVLSHYRRKSKEETDEVLKR